MRQELKQTYWPLEMTAMDKGFVFELRSQLAWELIQRFALIAADDGGEDSHGRAKLRLLTTGEVVVRAYAIADEFVTTAEARAELRQVSYSDEAAMERSGALARIKSRAEFPLADMPATATPPPTMSLEEIAMRTRHAQERRELREREARAAQNAEKSQQI